MAATPPNLAAEFPRHAMPPSVLSSVASSTLSSPHGGDERRDGLVSAAPPQLTSFAMVAPSQLDVGPSPCDTSLTALEQPGSETIASQLPSQLADCGESVNVWSPRLGMEFSSIDEAWQFWKNYAMRVGFGVRRRVSNKGKGAVVTSTCFVCAKEGCRGKDKHRMLVQNHRPKTRMSCHARMAVKLDRRSGKYKVYDFDLVHSHVLHFAECTHLIRSHRQISDIQAQQIVLANNAGLTHRQQYDLSSVQAGGRANVGYTRVDLKNYICTKRERQMQFGEAGCLLGYFENRHILDTSFFHAVQLDSNEQITNIFWADSRMIIDYALFGDVVTFHTTFSTNKEYRPLGVFIGFNHHRGLVIFGAALLYDETADSFRWLFEKFLEAHKSKWPATIFTDQDAAMAKALSEVIPETRHGLCTWHLMQNAVKNLGHLMKNGSNFLSDLKKLVYEYVEVEVFEKAWATLVSSYGAADNLWLKNLYNLKEKWASCFMKTTVTLGIRSTQLSESLNGDLKDYLKCTINLDGFFKRFDKMVANKRYKELQAEFQSQDKLPNILLPTSPMLQDAAKVYTPYMFEKFQLEWMQAQGLIIKERKEMDHFCEYIVGSYEGSDAEYKVIGGPSKEVVKCACYHFETVGILCCHVLKVFDNIDVKIIPKAYISKRWTRQARNGILEKHGLDTQGVGDMDATDRYRELCPELVKMAVKASQSVERYEFMNTMIVSITKSLDEMQIGGGSLRDPMALSEDVIPKSVSIPSSVSLKKKDGRKGGKQHKGCLEKRPRKNKPTDALKLHRKLSPII